VCVCVCLNWQAMQYSSSLLLERDDAESFDDGEEFTLMKWGNAILVNKIRDAAGTLIGLEATLNVAGDFKKTKKKITWIANTEDTIPVQVIEFDFLITKAKMEDDEDFMGFVNPCSKAEVRACSALLMHTALRLCVTRARIADDVHW
jgi:glutamyl-tRNA synthetase